MLDNQTPNCVVDSDTRHIGGIRELSHADLLVSAEEWRSLQRPLPEPRGLLTDHIDLPGLQWTTVDFAPLRDPGLRPFTTGHDLFGDGALVLLPTPGHTPGSMSLLVRRPDAAALLLVGDLTYDIHAFDRGIVGGVGNTRQLQRTGAMARGLRSTHPGMAILAAHDPAAAGPLDAATAA